MSDLRALRIDTPSGSRVRLDELAEVSIVPVPNVIHHYDLFRSIDVGANIDSSRDLGSVVADVDGTRLRRLAAGVPRRDAGRVHRAAGCLDACCGPPASQRW